MSCKNYGLLALATQADGLRTAFSLSAGNNAFCLLLALTPTNTMYITKAMHRQL